MDRREFLTCGSGLAAILAVAGCSSLIEKIPAVQQQKEYEQAEKGGGDPHIQVITRLVVDLCVLSLGQAGTSVKGEDVYNMIAVAREAVENGADPSNPNFWEQIGGQAQGEAPGVVQGWGSWT